MANDQGFSVRRLAAAVAVLGLGLVTGCATGPRITLPASDVPLVYPATETVAAAPRPSALQITGTVAECVIEMQRRVRDLPGPTALAYCGCLVDSSVALLDDYGNAEQIPAAAMRHANEGCAEHALSTTVQVSR